MDLEKLKNRDYVLLIDKSGSMDERDCAGGKSRWLAAQESTLAIARRCQEYDPDGISVVPFAGKAKLYESVTPDKVEQVFKEKFPMGSTNTAAALQLVFDSYLERKKAGKAKPNGEICLVITDGLPDDEDAVAKAIVNFGNKLGDNADEEYGISFIQVGKDQHASAYLKRLDDHLTKEGAKYDIVDTKTFDEVEELGLTEVLVAALTD